VQLLFLAILGINSVNFLLYIVHTLVFFSVMQELNFLSTNEINFALPILIQKFSPNTVNVKTVSLAHIVNTSHLITFLCLQITFIRRKNGDYLRNIRFIIFSTNFSLIIRPLLPLSSSALSPNLLVF
jgi:hypothetical protein